MSDTQTITAGLRPAMYLFSLVYWKPNPDDKTKDDRVETFIVAQTWEQAREYFKEELEDTKNLVSFTRHLPVLSVILAKDQTK